MDSDRPSALSPGQTICLTPDDAHQPVLSFTILDAFTPFTNSVVLLVRSHALGDHPVVLKIFDPRFLHQRLQSSPYRPWSLAAEQAAATLDPAPYHDSLLDDPDPDNADPAAQLARAALCEAYYRRLLLECYHSETRAYDRLRDFQGAALPRLLLRGTVTYADPRALRPPAIVLEHIPDAITLRDIPSATLRAAAAAHAVCLPLVRAIDDFAPRGLVHGDINPGNILFSPRVAPTRAVLLDFGSAAFRLDAEDDQSWAFQVNFAHDARRVRQLLNEKGVDVPPEGAPAPAV